MADFSRAASEDIPNCRYFLDHGGATVSRSIRKVGTAKGNNGPRGALIETWQTNELWAAAVDARWNHTYIEPITVPRPSPSPLWRIHRLSWLTIVWFFRRGARMVYSMGFATREHREEATRCHRKDVAARGVHACD